jgi:hypothetical protein
MVCFPHVELCYITIGGDEEVDTSKLHHLRPRERLLSPITPFPLSADPADSIDHGFCNLGAVESIQYGSQGRLKYPRTAKTVQAPRIIQYRFYSVGGVDCHCQRCMDEYRQPTASVIIIPSSIEVPCVGKHLQGTSYGAKLDFRCRWGRPTVRGHLLPTTA